MRKSEPDTKYFVKSLESEVLPVKIDENRWKLCKLFTVWLPKGIDDVQILLGLEILSSTSDFLPKIKNLSTNFDDFFCKILLNLNPSKNARNRNAF